MNQPLANNNQYEEYLKELRDSTMFHMSLGSKELFHSNFLHWISIVNWDAFLQIMRDLAGLKKDEVFWWEKEGVLDCHEKPYHTDNNNIEVRREFHNFDLSIYILDSEEKHAKESQEINDKESNNKEDINTKGERLVQKWIPVLILENKMKSLPYEEQLERYTNKTCEEWRKGARQSDEIKKTKNSNQTVLNTQYGITFILLSLIRCDKSFDGTEKVGTIKYKKNKEEHEIKVEFVWKHKTYEELLDSIEGTKTNPGWDTIQNLNQLVVEDYCNFVRALCKLAKDNWGIYPKKSYRLQIFPWNIDNYKDAENKRNEIEGYKKLRIHDIHEKLLYDQLLSMLEQALPEKSYRYSKEAIQAQSEKDKPIRLYTNSGYAHGIGLFEVHYILSDISTPQPGKKEVFKLIIQVQGDRYCHMVCYDDIVDDGGQELSVNASALSDALETAANIKPKEDTLANYISIGETTPEFPWSVDTSWGKYGENLIYQYVEIPPTATIQDVIDAMANDIEKIKGWFSPIKDILY